MSNEMALYGVPVKYLSLATLTLQNSLLTILMHYSRVYGRPYNASAAVLVNELLKGSISFGVAIYSTYRASGESQLDKPNSQPNLQTNTPTFVQRLGLVIRRIASRDCWQLSIPALLYVLRNNMQFVAASNLDVATFQICYQLKILTTALFSVILLKRRLTTTKWAALFVLAVGVAVVQMQTGTSSHHANMNPLKGFLAVAGSCITSGLAGVYFELILKGASADLWVRNVQLSVWSIAPALLPALGLFRPATDSAPSLFTGFGGWAWAVVLCQVVGGLVTAVVIKYTDNIVKGFATSLSIVLSFIASVVFFQTDITPSFVAGSMIVLGATAAYNRPCPSPRDPILPATSPKLPSAQFATLNSLKLETSPTREMRSPPTEKLLAPPKPQVYRRRSESHTFENSSTPEINTFSFPTRQTQQDSPYFHYLSSQHIPQLIAV